MSTIERINVDLTSAMKNKDELELSALRLVRSSLTNKRIELGKDLTDADAVAVIKAMKKQYADALTDFQKANRTDLAERQKAEIAILERYLPVSMAPEELETIVADAVQTSGATGPGDLGKAMGAAMKAVEGHADGNDVRAIVQRLLAPPE